MLTAITFPLEAVLNSEFGKSFTEAVYSSYRGIGNVVKLIGGAIREAAYEKYTLILCILSIQSL